MSVTNQFESVDEYYNGQPEKTKQALVELKECILIAAPNATKLFNYNIPAYTLI